MKTLQNKCEYWQISRQQQYSELMRGLGLEGTQSYKDKGCYECEGYNLNCNAYYNLANDIDWGDFDV